LIDKLCEVDIYFN